MRERHLPLRHFVLALSFGLLLALPAVAVAQSGPQPAIAMEPASAGPGSAVEVTGRDFPTQMDVALRLTTDVGTFSLDTAETARDGTFRQIVVLPALPVAGAWAVEAQAADGTTASHAFDATAPAVAPVEAAPVQDSTVPAATVAGDNATSDGVVLVIIGCLLGMVSTGALYAWRLLHEERVQPGMGEAEDVIWSDRSEDESAEPTATSEPFWEAGPREVETVAREVETVAREVPDSGEQEASASA